MFTTDKPSIRDFLEAYKAGIIGTGDRLADLHEGSFYELIGGMAAMVWSREAQHDTDLFRNTLTATADSEVLTARLNAITGIPRYLDTAGVGSAYVSRPSTAAGSGTFYEGTTIGVVDKLGGSSPVYYEVAADTFVPAAVTSLQVPIRSKVTGNTAISVVFSGQLYPRFEDIVWDLSWQIDSLTCAPGTTFEPANDYRARAARSVLDRRNGFERAIIRACKKAGAAKAVLFSSNYAGTANDFGLNMCYVADANGGTSTALLTNVMLALESVRILGDALQVEPMVSQRLIINLSATLTGPPNRFALDAMQQRIRNVLIDATKSEYSYSLDAWRGAIFASIPNVQDVAFTTPSIDATVMVTNGPLLVFPQQLIRYVLRAEDITIAFQGPV